ncbi:hypothetical protein [Streptomyces salinarius]|uniref:hypothetical protein n=1 Tax=Streptomyces salinarius TaxID=2762598 RepID=UPI001648EEC3|nr:hypothetical protein [Streptomyces salinarius]
MKLFHRTPKAEPKPVDHTAVAEGLRALAADLDAGDDWAATCITYLHELSDQDLADYPTGTQRRIRIAYFGQPCPGDVPDADYHRLLREVTSG